MGRGFAAVAGYLVRGFVGLCALGCVAVPLVVLAAHIATEGRLRIEGPHGASVGVRCRETVVVRLIGYAPGTDGDYPHLLYDLFLCVAAVPIAWFLGTRRWPTTGRFDAGLRQVCGVCPFAWGVATLVMEPTVLVMCVVPLVGVIVVGCCGRSGCRSRGGRRGRSGGWRRGCVRRAVTMSGRRRTDARSAGSGRGCRRCGIRDGRESGSSGVLSNWLRCGRPQPPEGSAGKMRECRSAPRAFRSPIEGWRDCSSSCAW